ncbi:hypothetical protein MD588_03825 [Photobacterium sp. SDRW27]|uniref:hypothetical protein n=1 Tax=Photobacterium obscurum TaxID=2829490 RepID=UPI002244EE7C|nr:hypothetical protein [Photobacterium obscurum]MCW8327928.1 hypothetical protein [Photobacterium obscurum]
MKTTVSALLLAAAVAAPAFAEQPAQLSVPGANFPEGNVKGIRATLLHGKTSQVTGLNVPILGLSETENFSGLSFGMLFGASRVTGNSTGVKLGLANWNDGSAKGADLGFVNYNAGQFTGLQMGAFNYTGRLNGLQFGFINATDRIEKGVQIGLINYDKSGTFISKDIPVFPLINARF